MLFPTRVRVLIAGARPPGMRCAIVDMINSRVTGAFVPKEILAGLSKMNTV